MRTETWPCYNLITNKNRVLRGIDMKITKTSDKALSLKNAREIANIGCNKCPCCGETKSHADYLFEDINKGIIRGLQKTWVEGLFKMKNMKCDFYHCLTCGAEWESEPYEWG